VLVAQQQLLQLLQEMVGVHHSMINTPKVVL
jgi:hypothetical protein